MDLTGITVLLVDDEELVLTSTAMLLERRGATVLRAASARQALDLAAEFDGDIRVAMIDLVMPEMRGDALLDKLKDTHPTLAAVLCSGFEPDRETQAIADKAGARFLQKPIPAQTLWSTVDELARG